MTEVEIKIVRQDHLLEQLSDVIYAQQRQLDLVEKKLKDLEKRIPMPVGPADEKPPHY